MGGAEGEDRPLSYVFESDVGFTGLCSGGSSVCDLVSLSLFRNDINQGSERGPAPQATAKAKLPETTSYFC